MNWNRSTGCIRQRRNRQPNTPNLKGGLPGRDVKHQLSNTVKALASSYRFQSFTEYKALLSIDNVQAEEVKGEANGKPYNGIVYSATNDKGVKQETRSNLPLWVNR